MILENGRVHTLDPSLPTTGAIAITQDGRVARGVEAWEGDRSAVSTERIDLDGRCVVPGLVDAHVHFLSWALDRARLDLTTCDSLAACLDAVAAAPPGGPAGWLLGRGWRRDRLDGDPAAALLDRVSGERPVALWSHDGHTLWLNTAAGRALAVDDPGGVMQEREAWALPLPEPGPDERRRAVVAAQRDAHARGVTGIHDFERREGFSLWQELAADRRLTLRVHAAQQAQDLDALLRTGLRTGFGGERLTVGPVKAFLDGALGSRTATMLEPYADGGSGVELLSRAGLEQLVGAASAAGLAVAVHAIGDRANRDALDAFAATRAAWETAELAPRIEHAQILHADDVTRFGELGVIASMQPVHATSDRDVADAALGERAELAYAWRALLDAGAALAFGSDAPIEDLDPLAGLLAAVRRTSDERPPWRPAQAIGAREALAAYTVGPAQAAGPAGRRRGRLIPGFDADLVVLEGDPTALPPERLGEVRVVATMVAGRWVHGRPPW